MQFTCTPNTWKAQWNLKFSVTNNEWEIYISCVEYEFNQ